MITAVRLSGTLGTYSFVGAMNQVHFQAWLRECLVPCLKKNDIVVMDGSSCHKSATARTIIENAGCHVLFLPPYSPDLNPDEQVWSKVKTGLRKLKNRTIDKLKNAISEAVKQITPKDCEAFFEHCGYAT